MVKVAEKERPCWGSRYLEKRKTRHPRRPLSAFRSMLRLPSAQPRAQPRGVQDSEEVAAQQAPTWGWMRVKWVWVKTKPQKNNCMVLVHVSTRFHSGNLFRPAAKRLSKMAGVLLVSANSVSFWFQQNCKILGVPSISILNPGSLLFRKPSKNRFLKRTMVEQNGESTRRKMAGCLLVSAKSLVCWVHQSGVGVLLVLPTMFGFLLGFL